MSIESVLFHLDDFYDDKYMADLEYRVPGRTAADMSADLENRRRKKPYSFSRSATTSMAEITRVQFLCSIYRIAMSLFAKSHPDLSPADRTRKLLDEYFLPNADNLPCDHLRRRMLSAPVQNVFRKWDKQLFLTFLKYCNIAAPSQMSRGGEIKKPTTRKVRKRDAALRKKRVLASNQGKKKPLPFTRERFLKARMTLLAQNQMLKDYLLFGVSELGIKHSTDAFLLSRDENDLASTSPQQRDVSLKYASFLEMMARLAEMRSGPNINQLLDSYHVPRGSVAELAIRLNHLCHVFGHYKALSSLFIRSRIHAFVKRFKSRHALMAQRSIEEHKRKAEEAAKRLAEAKVKQAVEHKRLVDEGLIEEPKTVEITQYDFEMFPKNLGSLYREETHLEPNMQTFYSQQVKSTISNALKTQSQTMNKVIRSQRLRQDSDVSYPKYY
jgi:hypothetical protein